MPILSQVAVLLALYILSVVAGCSPARQSAVTPFDLVIRNGHVIDGTGSPWYSADLGIRAGRIAAIGALASAQASAPIDAHGMVVAPGFIDMLGQSELTVLVDPRLPSKIYQGITTEITGEGNSVAPLNDTMVPADHVAYEHYQITPDWRTLAEYFARLEKQGIGINLASYVGATRVRRMVIGYRYRPPRRSSTPEYSRGDAMQKGAVGFSTSLQYCACAYATTEELIALAREASKYGGIYASHMRSEGTRSRHRTSKKPFGSAAKGRFRSRSGT